MTQIHNGNGDFVVLMPARDPDKVQVLLPTATALAHHHNGRVIILGIAQVPEGQPLSDGMLETRRIRAGYDTLRDLNASGVPVSTMIMVAHDLTEGIRTAVKEQAAGMILLGWQADQSSSERLFGPPIDTLLREPPCDVVVIRLQDGERWRRVLLPVRGGPHTPLACEVALALAEQHEAAISVLYAANPRMPDNVAVRESLQALRTMPRVTRWLERTIPAEQAILSEAPDHQAIVLGVTGRQGDPEAPLGPLADRILRHADTTVVLVRHRMAQDEERAQQIWQQNRDLSATVDRWFAENTFSSSEFEDLQRLLALKQQQGVTISLALPTLNEEETIGPIIEQLQAQLVAGTPILDELVLIDSGSDDRTREIAASLGVPVYAHQEILPQYGSFVGKGEALWKSLYVLNGDLIAWCDTDIRNFHPRFVFGVLGPLLHDRRIVYTKGFYRRPLQFGDQLTASGGGRVTELTARPLLNLFYPELSGMLQPLSGEYAGRRTALEQIPFFTGYGVETGMLIDLLERYGLGALGQVDLLERVHRNQTLVSLSKMAFAITQVVIQRMEQRQRVSLLEPVNQTMKLITQRDDGGFHLELREIRDHERPAMVDIPEYRRLRGLESDAEPRQEG
ncbi:glucosyl-3-phosphoglycerate synthase [Candidatus Chloroploca sp. Khr17]|uniref:glucosyl-3-phosphoglycerate synthase n=1 Tax=Candidatus Chloroploca sp. Khr17 TaxID=2496869 RepID=UPI00101D7241|nr:glucosyl-3-phosphoglycerate synthase [Candidatus Chloroploca sp. Khr17]